VDRSRGGQGAKEVPHGGRCADRYAQLILRLHFPGTFDLAALLGDDTVQDCGCDHCSFRS
jgi:hypothetical protein